MLLPSMYVALEKIVLHDAAGRSAIPASKAHRTLSDAQRPFG